MKHGLLMALLGVLACGPSACTVLVGLGAGPTSDGEMEAGAETGVADARVTSAADGGDSLGDTARATDASDATDTTDATEATDATDANDGAPTLLLLSPSVLRIDGVTTDGWVVYRDPSDNSERAVSLAGGSPVLVAPDMGYGAEIEGKVAIVYPASGPQDYTVWTSKTGPHSLPYVNAGAYSLRASSDGSRLAYFAADSAGDASSVTIRLVEAAPDLSNPQVVGPAWNRDVPGEANIEVADDRFVVTTPLLLGDGTSAYSCDSYTNDGLRTHLFDNSCFQAPGGHEVVSYGTQAGGATDLLVQSVSGGVSYALSPQGEGGGGVQEGFLAPDGGVVVFADLTGNFWSFSLADLATTALPNAGGFNHLNSTLSFAADGSHFLYWQTESDASGTNAIASVTAGNAVPVNSLANGPLTFLSFSRDSRTLILSEGQELEFSPVSTNVPVLVASNIDDCAKRPFPCIAAAHDSWVAYLSNGDLWAADANDVTHPRMLARSVVEFVLDSTGTTAVYRFTDSSADNQSGLYAVALP